MGSAPLRVFAILLFLVDERRYKTPLINICYPIERHKYPGNLCVSMMV
jgi:hypothetical protein